MTQKLEVGRTHTVEKIVTPEVTASAYGNPGVKVFATPALVALLETTAIGCFSLEEGEGSVGTMVDIQHLAATPIGMKVTVKAEIIEVDRRRVVFKVEANDEYEQIATGTHERFIIGSMEKFLARAAEKSSAVDENREAV